MSTYGNVNKVTNSSGVTPIPVASTNTVYSHSFRLNYGEYFGVWYKAASSGTVNLKIQLESSAVKPATEGSADSNYVIGTGVADINTALADTTVRVQVLAPVPMLWHRLKITGGASNDASTTIDVRIFEQGITV